MDIQLFSLALTIGRIIMVLAMITGGALLSRIPALAKGTYFMGAASYLAYLIATYSLGVDSPSVERLISVYGLATVIGVLAYVLWKKRKDDV